MLEIVSKLLFWSLSRSRNPDDVLAIEPLLLRFIFIKLALSTLHVTIITIALILTGTHHKHSAGTAWSRP